MGRLILPNVVPSAVLLELLCVWLFSSQALAVCPPVCSCSASHRDVDCSRKALSHLPDGLQLDVISLNLSHNRILDLDGQLAVYTHLRFLDLSHNRLSRLPAGLPRSLWELRAASNRLRSLGKNDTAPQWNLRLLDLSSNRLERSTFINNTLINLRALNLSRNHFRTVPTNLPVNLRTVDLSHNSLLLVLPGSLDRLPRLTHLLLDHNRFSELPLGALDKLVSLGVTSLGDNPWACHPSDNAAYLVSWTRRTPAQVLGCPCSTRSVCGGASVPASSPPRPPPATEASGDAHRRTLTPTLGAPVGSTRFRRPGGDGASAAESSPTGGKKATTPGNRRKSQAVPSSSSGRSILVLGLLVFLQQQIF